MEWKKLCINLNDLIQSEYVYYAHIRKGDGRKELLQEHTDLCIEYCRKIFEQKGMEQIFTRAVELLCPKECSNKGKELFWKMLINVINLHDIGKVNPFFQAQKMDNKLNLNINPYGSIASKHSLLSSLCYVSCFINGIEEIENRDEQKVLRHFLFMNAYLISRHHSDLSNYEEFMQKFQEDEPIWKLVCELSEASNTGFCIEFDSELLWKTAYKEERYLKRIGKENAALYYAYIRFLYSLLVACDYYATTEFMNKIKMESFGCVQNIKTIQNQFEQTEVNQSIRKYEKERYQKKSDTVEDINVLRSELFLDTQEVLKRNLDAPIFYLEAPTGSGKSNTAFNLSFQLASENSELKKIYYVYPFNTLVEQNYKTLQKTFGKEGNIIHEIGVINSLTPIKVEDEKYEQGLLDREFLNFPIVMTTSVSLFQVLFGEKQENLLAFHQLCNSIIVLDEIQNYKSLIWSEIITFFTAYAKLLNIKFIIMSATLPDLSSVSKIKERTVSLVSDRKKYFENPLFRDRVKVHYDLLSEKMELEQLYQHVMKKEKDKKLILMEFISKKTAYEFYEMLCNGVLCGEIESETALMTGDNNGLEREEILERIDCFQKEQCGFILVATQVVEAGVDIDMDIGYKDISKVDSEEQFMGRINRSCRKKGEVFFFMHDRMKQIYGNDYRGNDEFSLKEERMREILLKKDFHAFYEGVLELVRQRGEEANDNNLDTFFSECVGKLYFPSIAERMKLIDEDDWSMSVYLAHVVTNKEGEEFDGRAIWKQYKTLLKQDNSDYARKQIELSEVRCKMNYFIYRVKKNPINYNDIEGDIYYLENGEKYFENGRLLKEKLEGDSIDFIDL